ncbi:ACSM3 synthetase, partial [Pycnonotus jocosus]|nr:ACSM3 synthetase [Pycnonotus jocosus]
RYWMNLTPSDIMWNTSDTGWAKSAYGSVFGPWICGSCVFVHNMPHFKPEVVGEVSNPHIPSNPKDLRELFYLVFLSSYKFPSLKHCLTAGEGLNPEVFAKWKIQTGVDIHEGYGQSETVAICGNVKGMKIKPGSFGKPLPPYDVQIVDDHGAVVPAGEEGTIALRVRPTRPFCMFSEYL